jgi:crotonobetainyl-CoA:carnitine CoA-transferase CaiB-like acyl-CoA transferase
LHDLGAAVVKVEPAGGDSARRVAWSRDEFGPMFASYNRGKQSVVLDLSTPQGCEAATRLALDSDVILQNARPGALQRAGLSAEALRIRNPRLIVACVTGYGADSPFASRPGFDIAAQAESGMMSINGDPKGPPMRIGFTLIDFMAAQAVTTAVLAALVRRGITGAGATIDVALVDVAIASMAYPWAEYGLTGNLPTRNGNGQPTAAPAADVIPTADGAVVVSAYLDEHFARLASAIERKELAQDPRYATNTARVANRVSLLSELAAAFRMFDTASLCERLNGAGVVAAAIRSFDQVRTQPNGASADLFVNIETPSSKAFPMPVKAFRMDGLPSPSTKLPAIGEHTAEVLSRTHAEDTK